MHQTDPHSFREETGRERVGEKKRQGKKKRLMFQRSLQAKYSQAPQLLQRNP